MQFTMTRLGATGDPATLPPMPSALNTTKGGLLPPNYYWVRYYCGDYSHQCTSCPANPPLGCWMIGGYAWGMREWYPDEFIPKGFVAKKLPPPFPVPKVTPKPLTPAYKPPMVVQAPPPPKVNYPNTPISTPNVPQPTPVVAGPTHHMGGVVGIGLVIAMVLTAARKYK